MRKRNIILLVNLIDKKYFGAYDRMIDELRPLLANPDVKSRLVERLEFRPDLARGDRKLFYKTIADLLAAAPDGKVLAKGCKATDLFRWLADQKRCNLNVSFQSLQRLVYQARRSQINK